MTHTFLDNGQPVPNNPIPAANENHHPTGNVVIAGEAKVGKTLSILNTLNDADGMSGVFSYQWLDNGIKIDKATQATYVVAKTDIGAKLSVSVSYTDNLKNLESLTSAETASVTSAAVVVNLKSTNGNDKLIGTAKADVLNGGLGFDELTGGTGADKFVYKSIKDAPVSHSKIDADTSKAKDQAFSKPEIGAEFSGVFTKAGQLFFDTTNHILYGCVNNDGTANFSIQLNGVTNLVASDLML